MLEYLTENIHIYGAIIGSVAGVIGAVVGVLFSLKHAKPSKDDIKSMIIFTICLILLVAGWLLISYKAPASWNVFAMPVYVILLLALIFAYSFNWGLFRKK